MEQEFENFISRQKPQDQNIIIKKLAKIGFKFISKPNQIITSRQVDEAFNDFVLGKRSLQNPTKKPLKSKTPLKGQISPSQVKVNPLSNRVKVTSGTELFYELHKIRCKQQKSKMNPKKDLPKQKKTSHSKTYKDIKNKPNSAVDPKSNGYQNRFALKNNQKEPTEPKKFQAPTSEEEELPQQKIQPEAPLNSQDDVKLVPLTEESLKRDNMVPEAEKEEERRINKSERPNNPENNSSGYREIKCIDEPEKPITFPAPSEGYREIKCIDEPEKPVKIEIPSSGNEEIKRSVPEESKVGEKQSPILIQENEVPRGIERSIRGHRNLQSEPMFYAPNLQYNNNNYSSYYNQVNYTDLQSSNPTIAINSNSPLYTFNSNYSGSSNFQPGQSFSRVAPRENRLCRLRLFSDLNYDYNDEELINNLPSSRFTYQLTSF